jgi:hypothetical protein
MSDTPRTDAVRDKSFFLYPTEGEVQMLSLARQLERELYDACLEKNIQQQRAETAERDLDELRIENAQLCEKLAAAQRGEDIPGLVRRIAKAERELELTRPVVEAAAFLIRTDEVGWRGQSDDPDEFACECCRAHHLNPDRIVHTETCAINKLIVAVRAYDAAREGKEKL